VTVVEDLVALIAVTGVLKMIEFGGRRLAKPLEKDCVPVIS